ncbi:MAG: ABC transporter ATP-binding protein [Fervidobacterium sp.]|uniref:ATP-binding cassette, subfamily B n=1 Tax=Fervidobacterium gondwanense DSM 13020 TaxID=1121883 RepID=A0A1M7SZC4_FERGO|nr:ABC transporter ATP-binding protein [Fervidobacterium gondwanense]UXF01068.1 ABC transporter ATP-binding protein [Fervidobacterium riparium]SHN63786.1 ATP-binding cassette, subfamily B [Fervidobacterium gondwanense DSM 13020]
MEEKLDNISRKKERIDVKLWQGFFEFLKKYKIKVLLLLLVMVLVGLIEATFPYLTRFAIDTFVVPKSFNGFWKFIAAFSLLTTIQSINTYVLIVLAGKIETGMTRDIRNSAFSKLQKLPLSFFDANGTGPLIARIMSDVQRVTGILSWGMVDTVWGISTMTFITFYLFRLNWKMALFVVGSIPVIFFVSLYFQKLILRHYRIVRRYNSEVTGKFNEGILGAKTTKILSVEEKTIAEFSQLTSKMRQEAIKASVISSIYTPIIVQIGSIVTALILVYGSKNLEQGSITYGTLAAFISYSIQFFEPLRELSRVMADVISSQAAGERVMEVLRAQSEGESSREYALAEFGFEGNVEFRNVSFKYNTSDMVLKNFNLKVKKGERIAIVGPTGSGKSTIVNLLGRFYEPTEGKIYFDGVNYTEIDLRTLRKNIGYVLQVPHLFNGTIAENIAVGKPGCTLEEIVEAAKVVNVHDYIVKLKDGYNTLVGEGGTNLSVGQRQLIALARVVLANPKIIVMDEATSSIDAHTEHIIQESIDKILHGRTSFVIAHRLSTIRSADRILVIENGEIIEDGSHEQLMKKRGHYYRLYMQQFVEEKEKELFNV